MPPRHLAAICLCWILALAGCNRNGDSSAGTNPNQGQGQEVSADPRMELVLKIEGAPVVIPLKGLSTYQSKPAAPGKIAPQGFELEGDDAMIAGRLSDGLLLAPGTNFEALVGKKLLVRRNGGDPTYLKLSKITRPTKVYLVTGGELTVSKAFFKKGEYAGVSGAITMTLQPVKLGNPDDPQNKGDQPSGPPIEVSGTFTSKVMSYPFEQI